MSVYIAERAEMVPYIPVRARTLLDVGAAAGGFARTLREAGADLEIWAVEQDPQSASAAEEHVDHVLVGDFLDPDLGLPAGHFDCVVFNDVLEHLMAPERALARARNLVADSGVVVASIPNIRHVSLLRQLALRGDWTYTDMGLLDRTHVKFFTAASMRSMFLEAGYEVLEQEGINHGWHLYGTKTKGISALHRISPRRADEFFAHQFAIVARPRR